MTSIEQQVAEHYTHGTLESAILAGLDKLKGVSEADPVDQLASVDEFHMGGRTATTAVAEQLRLGRGLRVLDVGCGLGGTARFLATAYGCRVAGVDLTPEYIEVGKSLNRQLGLDGQINLSVASALAMPYEDRSFDRCAMLHVGMNISDKNALFSEIARVTKTGGYLVVYDVMRSDDQSLAYPVAWARDETTSFVGSIEDYRNAMEENGFQVLEEINKRDLALEFFKKIKERLAEAGPPPLGLHIVMGKEAPQKVANMSANIQKGSIAPVQILARRR
ncbi:MAG: class I SAM-dependent methyltransferase [Roseiarcus sp.]